MELVKEKGADREQCGKLEDENQDCGEGRGREVREYSKNREAGKHAYFPAFLGAFC